MQFVDFRIARTLDEARAQLKELGPAGFPVAGGTSLVFIGGDETRTAVDISRLDLGGIRPQGGGFAIGATTRIAELRRFHADGWVLDRVARRFVTQQIRNTVTLGGNISRLFPWSDFPVALLALDAEIEVAGDTVRALPAGEFFRGQTTRLFGAGELIREIRVPRLAAGSGFGYRKVTRTESGFSLFTAAAVLAGEGGRITSARVVAGAALPLPRRLSELEGKLVGQAGGEALFQAAAREVAAGMAWTGKAGCSDEYAGRLAAVELADALTEAWKEAVR